MQYDVDMHKIALLIDYENFSCPPEGLERFISDCSQRGMVVVKRAYADWVKCAGHRIPLLASQVEMIELPYASKGKNSADIRLVIDAMELVFTKPHIDTFVIASGDADFLPLLSRLREYDKRTIVVASSGRSHAYMQTHCDEFVNGDVYLNIRRKPTSSKPASLPVSPKSIAQKIQEPTAQQVRQIKALFVEVWRDQGMEQPFNLAALGYQIKKTNAELNWKEYGFESLKPLVAYLVTVGFLRIELANGSNDRIYLVRPSNGVQPNGTCGETGGQAELVSMLMSLIKERIRWDTLRKMLVHLRPKLLQDYQNDDEFLKLLQSLDAHGSLDLEYDPSHATYYVTSARIDRLAPGLHKGFTTVHTESNLATNQGEPDTEWTQPGLF